MGRNEAWSWTQEMLAKQLMVPGDGLDHTLQHASGIDVGRGLAPALSPAPSLECV